MLLARRIQALDLIHRPAKAAFEPLTLTNQDDQLRWQAKEAWPNTFRAARFISAVDLVPAERLRRRTMEEMARLMSTVDLIVSPPNEALLVATNFTGHPSLTLRVGFVERRTRPPEPSYDGPQAREIPKLKSKDYMDRYINPPEILEQRRAELVKKKQQPPKFPEKPIKDVLWFLINYAPLRNWQRDVLSIVRDEAYYFAPQRQTKIMNEGWATFWHSRLMTTKILADDEIITYADHHSGTVAMAPGQMNPYKIGVELFRDIEERWNKGRLGKEYDECRSMEEQRKWDKKLGKGLEKVFEVRRIHNDVTFIDTFLTPEFCREHGLFSFHYNEHTNYYEIESREFSKIKERLLFNLTNFGRPHIYVEDGNYNNRGEVTGMANDPRRFQIGTEVTF